MVGPKSIKAKITVVNGRYHSVSQPEIVSDNAIYQQQSCGGKFPSPFIHRAAAALAGAAAPECLRSCQRFAHLRHRLFAARTVDLFEIDSPSGCANSAGDHQHQS